MDYSKNRRCSFAPIRVMTVIGEGQISVQPNNVQLQFAVITEGTSVTETQQENARIMNHVIQALLSLNIPREDIQTVTYNVIPNYDFIEGKQIFRGYEVTNAITLKIRDISQVGRIIDIAVQNGVNRVSAIQFSIEDEDAYYQQALHLAFQNAQQKAKTLAETMHLPYTPYPIEILEESEQGPIAYRSFSMDHQTLATPIEQGKITINAKLRVTFQY